jgi:small-conductance mechanosensitive channel
VYRGVQEKNINGTMSNSIMKKILLLIILWLPLLAAAQTDSVKQKKDSVALDKTTIYLKQIDSIHRADSMRRAELLSQIENLKGSASNRQREALLKKLKEAEQEDSIKKETQYQQLEKLKSSANGFPVAPFGDTLFLVYTRMGSFNANDRAAAISSKINKLSDDYNFNPDSLTVHEADASAEIIYRDFMVMSVNELEALWFDQKPKELATHYRTLISDSIKAERKSNSILNIALRILAIILIIGGIYIVIRLINKLFKKINEKLIKLKDSALKGIQFRGYQFLDSDRELQVILFLTNIVRLLVIALALYIALPLLFSVFPWTRGIAETLISWILTPLKKVFGGILSYLPNLFSIIVIVTVTHYIVKFLKFIAGEIESGALQLPGFYPDWAKPTLNIIKFLVYAFSFVVIFKYLPGSDSPIFQGVSVFVGILFSLGSSSAISNAVAGLVITYMRPFKIGDRIKIGDLTGDVMEKSLLVTRIRTIKNENITIPNSTILAGSTINYTSSAKETGLILHTSVTIGYDVPWNQVHELLIKAAKATNGIMQDENHKPFVLQTSLDDFYVAYQINAYTEQSHRMAGIYSDLHQNIQDQFNEAGVEILSPHYRAARDGNILTIPPSYLPKDYQVPSFNVSIKNSPESKKE